MSDFIKMQAEINRLASEIATNQKKLGESKLIFNNGSVINFSTEIVDTHKGNILSTGTVSEVCLSTKTISFEMSKDPDDDDDTFYKERKIKRSYNYEDDKDHINELDENMRIRNKLYRENNQENYEEDLDSWHIANEYSNDEDEDVEDED